MNYSGSARVNSVDDFRAALGVSEGKARALVALAHRGLVETFVNSIVFGSQFSTGTPIDTGFARASWQFSVDKMPPLSGPSAPTERVKVPDPILDFGAVVALNDCYLASNCAYMNALENGHSQQAPQGMIRQALAAAQRMADSVSLRVMRGARRGAV